MPPPKPAATSKATSTSTYVAPTTSSTPPPPPKTSSHSYTTSAKPSTSAQPSSSAKASSHKASSYSVAKPSPSAKAVGSSGGKYAMTYSPYKGTCVSDTSCKSQGEVESDIAAIAGMGFSVVRIYATDCSHLPNVIPAAKAHGLKVILGIFIKDGGINDDTYSQLSDITSYFKGDYSSVEYVLAGNEAVFNGKTTAGALASFIGDVKSTLKKDGYSGLVGTAETVSVLCDNADAFSGVLGVVGANMHPFFAPVEPSEAGTWLKTQFDSLAEHYGSTPVINSESGYPHSGPPTSGNTPSSEAQKAAISSMAESEYAGKTVFFSNADDGWKATSPGSEDSVEPYWGCADQF